MDDMTIHDLTAAYALDALDAEDERAYEEHLGRCERCRVELAELTEAATALAFAVDSPAAPPELRGRILDAVREERPNVVTLRPRWAVPAAALAVAAAAAAIAVGVWAGTQGGGSLSGVISRPGTQTVALNGAAGALIVQDGTAALVTALAPVPAGKTYQAWVIDRGAKPRPAGTYSGRGHLVLGQDVRPGSVVAVTVEPAGGSPQPTSKPVLASDPVV